MENNLLVFAQESLVAVIPVALIAPPRPGPVTASNAVRILTVNHFHFMFMSAINERTYQ